MYVVAVAIKTHGASETVKDIFKLLSATKIGIFAFHMLSSMSLIGAVYYRPKLLRIISLVFVVTETTASIYTAVECMFTILQLHEDISKTLLSVIMLVSIFFMGWCVVVVTRFTHHEEISTARRRVIIVQKNVNAELPLVYHPFFSADSISPISNV